MKNLFTWFVKLILKYTVLLVFLSIITSVVFNMNSKQKLSNQSKIKVGVVDISGVIMSSQEVVNNLIKFSQDKSIKSIVVRVDSPGGAVAPSQEIANLIKEIDQTKKPVVVSMSSVAASGGLYVSLGARRIFAQSGTLTGSIGVIMQVPNFYDASKKLGIKMETIKSGELKDSGNSFREMTQVDRNYLEQTSKTIHNIFIDDVITLRNLDRSKVIKYMDGRIIIGKQALELGIIDEIGGLIQAGRYSSLEAGFDLKDQFPKFVYIDDKIGNLKKILQGSANIINNISSNFEKIKVN